MIRIYVCMHDSIVILEGEPSHWNMRIRFEEQAKLPVPEPEPGKSRFTPGGAWPQSIAIDPHRPERVYCASFGQGLWISDDAGNIWQRAGAGITECRVMAVAVSPIETGGGYGVVWAGTEPSRLFRSEDGGQHWQECEALQSLPSKPLWHFPPRPYTHHVRWIQPDLWDADRLYIGIHEGGVIRTLDRGKTFQDHDPNAEFDPHGVAMHPLAPGRVYESAGGNEKTARFQPKFQLGWPPFIPQLVITEGGYAETRDGGATWQRHAEGLEKNHYLWEVAVDPADPDTMIASAAIGPIQAHTHPFAESYLVRRAAGQPWQRVTSGLPAAKDSIVYDLATNPAEPGVFYAANNKGVFRSEDAGLNWRPLAIAWPQRYLKTHQADLAVVQIA